MKLLLWSVGKSNDPYVKEGVEEFTKRISKYYPVEWALLPLPKHSGLLSEADLKKKEGEIILQWLKPDDYLVALDEYGKEFSSVTLANFIQQRATESTRNLVFL